jgi:hypothetical protein
MLKFLRYALATFCFVASICCLALWWRSTTRYDLLVVPNSVLLGRHMTVESMCGGIEVRVLPKDITTQYRASLLPGWRFEQSDDVELIRELYQSRRYADAFGIRRWGAYFPLWYPALILALAGVAALKLGRRFTLRSAIIATTVVAALLGMVIAL